MMDRLQLKDYKKPLLLTGIVYSQKIKEEMNMTKERLEEVLNNVIAWGGDHDEEFRGCLLYAMDLTDEEIKELELEDYVTEEDDEDDDDEEEED